MAAKVVKRSNRTARGIASKAGAPTVAALTSCGGAPPFAASPLPKEEEAAEEPLIPALVEAGFPPFGLPVRLSSLLAGEPLKADPGAELFPLLL